jgi:hypothetical protein
MGQVDFSLQDLCFKPNMIQIINKENHISIKKDFGIDLIKYDLIIF